MDSSFPEVIPPHSDPAANSSRPGLMRSIRQQIASAMRHRRIRRDIKLLKEFDDRMLADIGLYRGDIVDAVRYGRPPHPERRGSRR